jgi:hypothetical protein
MEQHCCTRSHLPNFIGSVESISSHSLGVAAFLPFLTLSGLIIPFRADLDELAESFDLVIPAATTFWRRIVTAFAFCREQFPGDSDALIGPRTTATPRHREGRLIPFVLFFGAIAQHVNTLKRRVD